MLAGEQNYQRLAERGSLNGGASRAAKSGLSQRDKPYQPTVEICVICEICGLKFTSAISAAKSSIPARACPNRRRVR